jgi:signal transduction histidine kinase
MSSNLLRLSELENEIIGTEKETFSLDEQIRDALLLLQTEWEKKNIEIDLKMDSLQFTATKHSYFKFG